MDTMGDRVELGAVRLALESRTRTPLGVARSRALAPFARPEEARARVEITSEARRVLARGDEPPLAGVTDVRSALDLGAKGLMLDSAQLRAIAESMRVSSALHRFLLAKEDDAPLLYGVGASMEDMGRLAEEVRACFALDGTLADDASPDLGALRKRLRQLHDAIKDKLGELVSKAEIRPYLMETYFTVRGDRYVLPVKSSFQNEIKGIVHDASGSGQTVFIEPQIIVELGNRLKIAASEVVEEEHRILSDLTRMVVAEQDEIVANLEGTALCDLVFASARMANESESAPIVPDERRGFDLIDARHPALVLQTLNRPDQEVIANDLGLNEEQLVLILTGPNTGGKTVAMKTIGLLALMLRCGLHLPCNERSRMGWFERVEAAIGDDQSIATNLSTFAAHMKQILRLLDRAGPETLVLLDEIAADTDPTQGQALAQAILEALADRGAHVVVTTHFERLKVVPFADKRFRNAGVGFDPIQLRPTYKVTLDLPQSSSGLDIAQSLGLGKAIVDRARGLAGEGSQALEALMTTLRNKQVELAQEKKKAEEALARLITARNEIEEKKRDLDAEKKKLLGEARLELVEEIKEARAEVRSVIAKLQKIAGSDAVRQAMREASEAASRLGFLQQNETDKIDPALVAAASREKGVPVSDVAIGDWIHVDKLEKDGEVVAVEGKEVIVAVGNMRTRSAIDGLSVAKTKRPKRGALHEAKQLKRALQEKTTKTDTVPSGEIDLRGQTIDDALARIDAFLDVHYSGPSSHVRIIHGHGSGALKLAIRDHLKRSGYVKSFRPGEDNEGGDGATVVELA